MRVWPLHLLIGAIWQVTYALSLSSSSGSQFPLTLATGWRRFFLWLEESLPEPAAPSEQMLR